MPALAITGTIGSGKSLALQSLKTVLGAESYSADEENGRLLDHDAEVRNLITSSLGASCYLGNGEVDRQRISQIIRGDEAARTALENILHPRLAAIWKPKAERYRKCTGKFYIAEIPLLFEKHLEVFFDKIIVVGCSGSVRRERLLETRSLSPREIGEWSEIQESQESKIAKTDHLLWNDGSVIMLQRQTEFLASHFLQK